MKIVFLTFSFKLLGEIDFSPSYYRKDDTLLWFISYLQFAFIFVRHIFYNQAIIKGHKTLLDADNFI